MKDVGCLFSDEVVVHLIMLCSSMKDGGLSKMDTAEIVAVEQVWIFDGDVQILKYPLEPYDFTCSHNCAPVFGLCARKCDNRLLCAAPRYCSAAEGENKYGGYSSIDFIAGPSASVYPSSRID